MYGSLEGTEGLNLTHPPSELWVVCRSVSAIERLLTFLPPSVPTPAADNYS